MRSVVVVLPASMCAMMPMLRQRSSGKVRATAEYLVRCGRSRAFLDWMKDCLRKNGLPQRTRAFTRRGTPRQVLGVLALGHGSGRRPPRCRARECEEVLRGA